MYYSDNSVQYMYSSDNSVHYMYFSYKSVQYMYCSDNSVQYMYCSAFFCKCWKVQKCLSLKIKSMWCLRKLFTQWHSITLWVSWLLSNSVLRTSNHVSFVFPTHRVVYLTTKILWARLWSVLVLDPFSEELLSRCQLPCGALLSCGHRCRGTCGECMQGRIHMPCKEKCGTALVCGHRYWLLVNVLNN